MGKTVEELQQNGTEVKNLMGGEGSIYKIEKRNKEQNTLETWFLVPAGSSCGEHAHEEYEEYKVLQGKVKINNLEMSPDMQMCLKGGEKHWFVNESGEPAILYSKKYIE